MSGRGVSSPAGDAGWVAAMEAARWQCTCTGGCGTSHLARTVPTARTARDGRCPAEGTGNNPLHAVQGPGGRLVAVCDTCHQGQVRVAARKSVAVAGLAGSVPVQAALFDMPAVTR